MTRYPNDCDHDYEQEQIEVELMQLHKKRECDGAPRCDYCLEEKMNSQTEGENGNEQSRTGAA